MAKIVEEIKNAVIEMKVEETVQLVREAVKNGVSAEEILAEGLISALKVVGEKFKRDEIFLPEVMLSANAFKASFEIIKPSLQAGNYQPRAKVVIGTVFGDVHDIGKNIVCALLEGNGYQIIDLGVNVPIKKFIDALRKEQARFLGMSTLLTTTLPEMEKVIKALKDEGLRERIKVIIGGAAVSKEYAERIGADGYGEDAQEGVEIINHFNERSS